MAEYGDAGHTTLVRQTEYGYDAARRLTQVDFDTDGDDTPDQTVRYAYNLGSLRTRLTLPGDLDVTYAYDALGRLVSLTDWDGQLTHLAYDGAGRQISLERANGLRTRAEYDAAGRLARLRHDRGGQTLALFAYQVDGRGNRTQVLECLAHPATTGDTVYAYDDPSLVLEGSWSDSSPYKVATGWSASLALGFFGDQAELTVGQGPDHGFFDVYVDGGLWRSFDGYAASPGDLALALALDGEGPHVLELRNRPEHHPDSTGCTLRFKQLVVADREYNLRTIQYTYDALARLTEARYNPGIRTGAPDADLLRRYQYGFDLVGNRLLESVAVAGGTPTVVNYTYNAANQITSGGVSYDADGNLTSDGTHTYTWDRAGRLLSMGGHSYAYDGNGVRISQTVSSIVTSYLNDTQPGLPVVLAQTTGGSTDRFVHLPGHGILAQQDNSGNWEHVLWDGLHSGRSVVDDALNVDSVENYAPFGTPLEPGSFGSPFMFTGEPMDANGLLYLRARYYSPALGVFTGLDPMEGNVQQAMSLNRYAYVQGSVVNAVDPSGQILESPHMDACRSGDADVCPISGKRPFLGRCWFEYSREGALAWALGTGRSTTLPYQDIHAGTYCAAFMFYVLTEGGKMPTLCDASEGSGFDSDFGFCQPHPVIGDCSTNARDANLFVNKFLKRGYRRNNLAYMFLPPVFSVQEDQIIQGDLIYQSPAVIDSNVGHISMFIGWGPKKTSAALGVSLETPGPGVVPEDITPTRILGGLPEHCG